MKSSSDSSESSGKSWVSSLQTYVNLVTVCIGAGLLALPQLPKRCGYVLSPLCLILAGLGAHEACLQLYRGLRHCGASTFEALGYEAMGQKGRVLAGVMVNVLLLGTCSAYAALIGTQLHNLTGSFFRPFISSQSLSYREGYIICI